MDLSDAVELLQNSSHYCHGQMATTDKPRSDGNGILFLPFYRDYLAVKPH